MTRQTLQVLLVEDNPGDARLLRALLSQVPSANFSWLAVERLAAAIEMLRTEPVDLVLLDLSLPDSRGLDTFKRLQPHAVCLPVVVLTGTDDETLALQAVQAGAQDYLVKGRLDGELLARAMQYAVERKRTEVALQAKNQEITVMTQQLLQAAKLTTMGELAASIAHELNNPLATVSLRVESLLAQVPDGDPLREALEVVEQEVDRMAALIANLLQFSRRSTHVISSLDIREEILKTLELLQYHLRQRQVVVVQEFASGMAMIHADRQQMRQLFLNLCTNAGDAMPDGGTLTLRAAIDSEMVRVEISDTGTGISPSNLAKVTEPFFTTKPEGKGTGLGLAICRRIVQEHGGTLDFASAGVPGQGTTVRLSLPVHGPLRENGLMAESEP